MKLRELVRDQILAEGPQMMGEQEREDYIDDRLERMTREEFLDRISDGLDKLLTGNPS
jgi:hypothetical protein